MTATLTIRIAEIPVRLELDCGDATRARIAEHYAAFVVPDSTNAFLIHIREQAGSDYIPLGSSAAWQIRAHAEGSRIDFESHHEKGWADCKGERGELVIRPQGDPENFLRVLNSWLCLERSGLLLHAAGVISGGKGYAFFGASGSGKTTVARLSLAQPHDDIVEPDRAGSSDRSETEGQAHLSYRADALPDRKVLSDDLVIIKKRGERYWLYGVPFRGDFPEAPRVNADAELVGIFALVKDTEHRVERLALPEAIARLTACVPFVMAQASNAARVVEICTALATRVPVRCLHFRRDAEFWELVHGR